MTTYRIIVDTIDCPKGKPYRILQHNSNTNDSYFGYFSKKDLAELSKEILDVLIESED